MKANYDARERAKKAKEEAKAREVCTHIQIRRYVH